MNNSKKYSEFIETCYILSQKHYTTILKPKDPDEEYLTLYQGMNVFPIFPRPIIMPIKKDDNDTDKLILKKSPSININLTKLKGSHIQLDNKMKEYMEYLDKIKKDRNKDKVRRYFDYEIRDRVNKIIDNSYVTNAWCKMYELLITYEPFKDIDNNKIKIFHLCEHPGAFIYACRDYIKHFYPDKRMDFIFQSLKPIDKKTFRPEKSLLNKFASNLDYGVKGTGDITDIDNIKGYIEKYKDRHFDLITSDCGLDCSDDFAKQEPTLIPIYFGAFISAIGLISKGGSYICKLFSFNEEKTIELIVLSCYFFKKVDICRALTDKGASGEVYLICLDFIYDKNDKNNNELSTYIDSLLDYYKNYNNNYIIDTIPINIEKRIIKHNYLMTIRRITNLNQLIFRVLNNEYIDEKPGIRDYIKQLTDYYVDYFVKYTELDKLIKK
jgi:hypothetical protein